MPITLVRKLTIVEIEKGTQQITCEDSYIQTQIDKAINSISTITSKVISVRQKGNKLPI